MNKNYFHSYTCDKCHTYIPPNYGIIAPDYRLLCRECAERRPTMSELKPLPCPFCGMELQIHGPENWHPTFYDPDSGGDPYNAVCDCGFSFSTGTYDYEEFVVALNRRAKPKECPALERVEGGIPYCSDKQTACDGCHQPDNAPLTLEELRGMVGEPVWVTHKDGSGGRSAARLAEQWTNTSVLAKIAVEMTEE